MKDLAKQLGGLQADIYWYHDAGQFDMLAQVASDIYIKIGKDKKNSKAVGDLIAESYILADEAEDARKQGEKKKEEAKYDTALQKLNSVEEILQNRHKVAGYQIKWWKAFRHKQTVNVIYYIFLQHLRALGVWGFFRSIILSYYLINIGLGHNRRDKKISSTYGEKYWKMILRHKPNTIPFLG